jgi:hypothetical protein
VIGALPRSRTARGAGRRHQLRVVARSSRRARPSAGSLWALFWDDRQAARLKVFLLACCLLAAAWLEVIR